MRRIYDLFHQLQGSSIFSNIDLRFLNHHLKIRTKDIPKMAFRTGYGHYEFSVISFRLAGVLATLMILSNGVFNPFM